ncbi:MAG TPA: hypothetical protein VFW22_08625 [Pseudolabrys sp.]|nr:hypothetical protein [Pseudolabrys sp.]
MFAVALGAALLAGCVDSKEPILADAQPMLGKQAHLQLYGLRDGHAVDPERVHFTWDGKRYVRAGGGGLKDIASFTLHAFDGGDAIVQSVSTRHPEHVEYALLHILTDGVYRVDVIDEDDADLATRDAQCKHPGGVACRIETREQLFTFARATAAKKKTNGGLAIRLGDKRR